MRSKSHRRVDVVADTNGVPWCTRSDAKPGSLTRVLPSLRVNFKTRLPANADEQTTVVAAPEGVLSEVTSSREDDAEQLAVVWIDSRDLFDQEPTSDHANIR